MPIDLAKHNSMDVVCKHLTDFMGILQQAVKFKLGAFDLKLIRLDFMRSLQQAVKFKLGAFDLKLIRLDI